MTQTMARPPRRDSYSGEPRRIGVELEFAAVSARAAATQVHELFGGFVEELDPHSFEIRGTALGDFRAELDSQFVHRTKPRQAPDEERGFEGLLEDFQNGFRKLLGDVGSLVLPCEIVCPPIELAKLCEIEKLLERLRSQGALGTQTNPFYAFGAQLNPEIAEKSADYIVNILRAYLLMSDWLRAVIAVDLTRRIVAFADPFPLDYVLLVTRSDYRPGMDRLIEDYLVYNPTRNRELDLLPLFAWIDADRVQRSVPDPRIKPRPAFHYRLPDARVGEIDWTITREWNRWCVVEKLAENSDKLALMAESYRRNQERFLPEDWAIRASDWILTG